MARGSGSVCSGRLEGLWLGELAAVDACGAAGADHEHPGGLHRQLAAQPPPPQPGAAHTHLRTAQALTTGELSVAHAATLAAGTHDLPHHTTAEAEPALLAAARRLDPPRLRRVIGHLRYVADPKGADRQAERRHAQRGLWLAATLEGMVALQGLLEAEAGQTLLAALAPLARPHSAADDRSGQRVRPTTYGTGWTAAPPTWPTWPCCAGPTTERSTRAAGS